MPVECVCENPACQKVFINKRPWRKRRFHSLECWYAFYGSIPPEQRFWTFVDRSGGPDACWIWTGGQDNHGYGHFTLSNIPRIQMSAHRYSFILAYGPITDGRYVCHDCPGRDNPLCVNYRHLFLGTQHENLMDASRKGLMHGGSMPGEKNPKAKLTEAQVYKIRTLQGTLTGRDVGKQFCISPSAVWRIWKRQYRAHLPERP